MDMTNLYASAAEYFEYHPNAAYWSAKTENERKCALKIAALDIESYLGVSDASLSDPALENAVFEQALWIIVHENGLSDIIASESIDGIGSAAYRERYPEAGSSRDPSLLLSPRARVLADACRRQGGVAVSRG